MDNDKIALLLTHRDIKPTPNRILVYRTLEREDRPLALSDVVDILGSMDKSSVFRVLVTFLEKDIVHEIDDGSGRIKYELCRGEHHSLSDMHAHFLCQECGEIFCLGGINPSIIEIPENFVAHTVNFVLKGLCPKCAWRH